MKRFCVKKQVEDTKEGFFARRLVLEEIEFVKICQVQPRTKINGPKVVVAVVVSGGRYDRSLIKLLVVGAFIRSRERRNSDIMRVIPWI